jgi:transcriptional regulator with XRE-family HTH domain
MNDSIPQEEGIVDVNESDFSETEKACVVVSEAKTRLKPAENSDDTIRRVLAGYDIGQKLRHLRLRKKIALVDLGKHTGLSASMLSQLENGKLVPTLPTLARIAMVFDVGLEFFFGEKRSKKIFSIVRAEERILFPELSDSPVPGYYFEVLAYGAMEKSISAYLAEFPYREPGDVREHSHDGAEFLHLFSGELILFYEGQEHLLRTGDSVYFDASEPHSYHGRSEPAAKAIVVTTPPRA